MEATTKRHQRIVVWVRRQFYQRESAAYDLEDIEGWHQSNVSGGVHAKANRKYWHGYVWCNGMIEGSIAHSCEHGPPPHRIKVCITKNVNRDAWPLILKAAETSVAEDRMRRSRSRSPAGLSKRARKVMECIIDRKFSRRIIRKEERLDRFRSVDRVKLEDAWNRFVERLNLSPTGVQHLQSIFVEEVTALHAHNKDKHVTKSDGR